MHKYLRAIGFSNISKEEFQYICTEIVNDPIDLKTAKDSEGNEFVEISGEFGDFFGITLRGIYRDEDTLEVEYTYPYFYGKTISTTEHVEVEKHAEKESYAGICDEVRIGVTLIFYLQNVVDYLKFKNNHTYQQTSSGVILSALSTEGKVLFPVDKSEQKSKNMKHQEEPDRIRLLTAARDGDEDAIENLTLEDIDTYSLLSRRVLHEDVLTIVNTYFMPYGIESDQYSILGEIMDYRLLRNDYTEERVYQIDLLCNDLSFSLCINEKDLIGEPKVGRRFKGIIWMQGSINYQN